MNKVKLGDVISVKHGWAFKGEFFSNSGNQIVLTPANFYEQGGFKTTPGKEKYYSSTYPAEYLLKKGNLVVAMTEQSEGLLGSAGFIPCDNVYLHNQRIGLITAKSHNIDLRFVNYLLRCPYVRKQIEASSSGSKVKHTSPEKLYDVDVAIPSLERQKEIANLLDMIDNKIALNKRTMSELEKTARLIYDYWFTQFDFPDENGNPYRTSGGKMAHNKTLNRKIPASWEAGTLADLACYGDAPISNSNLTVDIYISTDNMSPNRGGITLSQYLPKAGFSSKYERYDILLSNIRPYFKKIWLADRVGGCCNDVLVIHPLRENAWAYLYWTLESEVFFAYDTAGAKGSKMPRGDKEHIMRYPLPIAPPELLERFSYKFKPLFQQHCELAHESTELATLRNWLLPMLMNGQVNTND